MTTRRRLIDLLTLSTVMAASLMTALAPAAQATQTGSFGLRATDEGTAVIVPSGVGRITEHFEIYNLTHRPITVDLGVVGASTVNGAVQPGGSGAANKLAGDLSLPAATERLAPGQLVVHRPGDLGTHQYAYITASRGMTPDSGIVPTAGQLNLLVILEPTSELGTSGSLSTWAIVGIAAGAAAVLGAVIWVMARRRRRAPA